MKKFRISLGVLLQQNYEVEIEAENEEEAIKLGIEAFRDGDERGEIVDFDGAEVQEDFDEDTKIGISAEEGVRRLKINLLSSILKKNKMTNEQKKEVKDCLEKKRTPIRHLILSYPEYRTMANLDTLELKTIAMRIGKDDENDEYIIKSNLGDISISVDSAEEISNWFRESGKLLSADLVSGTKELSNNYHHNKPISTSLQALLDKLEAKEMVDTSLTKKH